MKEVFKVDVQSRAEKGGNNINTLSFMKIQFCEYALDQTFYLTGRYRLGIIAIASFTAYTPIHPSGGRVVWGAVCKIIHKFILYL